MNEITLEIDERQVIVLSIEGKGGQVASSLERETCPSCGQADCCFSCDGSQGADENNDEEDVSGRLMYNGVLDAIESLALAHAIAGIDVTDARYTEGLRTTLEAAGNNL